MSFGRPLGKHIQFKHVDHDEQKDAQFPLGFSERCFQRRAPVCLSVAVHAYAVVLVRVYVFNRNRQAANRRLKNLSGTR